MSARIAAATQRMPTTAATTVATLGSEASRGGVTASDGEADARGDGGRHDRRPRGHLSRPHEQHRDGQQYDGQHHHDDRTKARHPTPSARGLPTVYTIRRVPGCTDPAREPLDRPGTIGVVSIEPDTKDWTWVIEEPCGQCGFDPGGVARADFADLVHENTRGWYDVLADPDFAVRPAPHVWSRLEYACHVRDVHELFAQSGAADARRGRPDVRELGPGRHRRREGLRPPGPRGGRRRRWSSGRPRSRRSTRRSRTSSGSAPVAAATAPCSPSRRSGVYHLHDVVHHLWDVTRSAEPSAVPAGDL